METGLGERENGPQIQCHGVGIHQLGVGTLTKVEGNTNADKYISIREDIIWSVIVRHFAGNDFIFQDDNAPVHRDRSTKEYLARTRIII